MGRRDPKKIRKTSRKKIYDMAKNAGIPPQRGSINLKSKILKHQGINRLEDIKHPPLPPRTNKNRVKAYDEKLPVIIDGPIFYNGSFGVVSRNLALAMVKAGINISSRPWKEGDRSVPIDKRLADSINSNKNFKESIHVRISHPDSFNTLRGKFNIGVGVTEERFVTQRIWVNYANRYCNQVWVPSHFVKESFKDAGIKNVKVVPNPINRTIFNRITKPYDFKTNKFVFLFVGVAQHRKGIDILIEAFKEEFDKDEAILVIKTFDWGNADKYKSDNIKIIHENMTENEVASLYTGANCFVLPSRGEGFGIPALEAMSCGCPVITTRYGGVLEFCDDDNSWLIDVESEEEPLFGEGKPYGARPSKSHLIKLMRTVFEGGDEINKKIKNALKTSSRFSLNEIGKRIAYLTRLYQKPMPAEYNGFFVKNRDKGDITYYDGWCGDSFSMVGLQHRKALSRYYKVYSMPISAAEHENRVSNSKIGILHPLMYNYDLISRLGNFYEVVGGFDVADTDHITRRGISLINQADFLVVPTEACKRIYISSGSEIPIHVCNHNLREDFYSEKKKPLEYVDTDKINIFYFCIHSNTRKGRDVYSEVSRRFRKNKDIQFWIRGGKMPYAKQLPWFDNNDLVRCYDSMDILMCPSRGGGFELNVLEAMSRGVIPIISDWEPIVEYSKELAVIINSRTRKTKKPLVGNPIHDGWGADPDPTDATNKLQYVLDNLDHLKKKANDGMMKVRKEFSNKAIGKTLAKIFKEYV